MYRQIPFTIALIYILSSCSNSPVQNNFVNDSIDSPVYNNVISDSSSFSYSSFTDSVYNSAKLFGFDTLSENGSGEINDMVSNRYISLIVLKKNAFENDLNEIKSLFNITFKHNSVKKPDSPDLTVDIYFFNDTSSCRKWKNKFIDLYHQSGGEPLKELYFIRDYNKILLHVTTRAFMWEDGFNAVSGSCNKFLESYACIRR